MVKWLHQYEADMHFQGKHSGETFQFRFYHHWVRLLWPAGKAAIKTAILVGVAWVTFLAVGPEDVISRRVLLELYVILFLLFQFEFLVRLFRYFLRVTVITDRKVHRIEKTLLMVDDHQSVDLWMIQDIDRCQHNIVENVLCYGKITLEAQETILKLHYVPEITEIYEKIMHLREQAREHMTPYSAVRRRLHADRGSLKKKEDRVFSFQE